MSALIFRLRHVPDEEAQAIRELLDSNGIDWFETSAGNWGIAMPGLWASNAEQVARAKQVIAQYQFEHATKQRELHEKEKQLGQSKTLMQVVQERPYYVLGIVIFCLFILYVSIQPFVKLVSDSLP
jgi:hypothetical protein